MKAWRELPITAAIAAAINLIENINQADIKLRERSGVREIARRT